MKWNAGAPDDAETLFVWFEIQRIDMHFWFVYLIVSSQNSNWHLTQLRELEANMGPALHQIEQFHGLTAPRKFDLLVLRCALVVAVVKIFWQKREDVTAPSLIICSCICGSLRIGSTDC
ncbi:hypothetical protein WS96_18295 [Burkholderia sp. MSMB1835]|nr:hypothetical protein WS96_18295 [Burkholderia sp. MSMB1835]